MEGVDEMKDRRVRRRMRGKRRNCQSKEEEGKILPRMRMRTSYTEVAL